MSRAGNWLVGGTLALAGLGIIGGGTVAVGVMMDGCTATGTDTLCFGPVGNVAWGELPSGNAVELNLTVLPDTYEPWHYNLGGVDVNVTPEFSGE